MYHFHNEAIFVDRAVRMNIVSLKGQGGLLGKIFPYFLFSITSDSNSDALSPFCKRV